MISGSQTQSKYGRSEAKSGSTMTKKSFLTNVLSPKSNVVTNSHHISPQRTDKSTAKRKNINKVYATRSRNNFSSHNTKVAQLRNNQPNYGNGNANSRHGKTSDAVNKVKISNGSESSKYLP